jgi:hypothetical protein
VLLILVAGNWQQNNLSEYMYLNGGETMSERTDEERIEWLCDHAILLGVTHQNGADEYAKISGASMCFRDIVDALIDTTNDDDAQEQRKIDW